MYVYTQLSKPKKHTKRKDNPKKKRVLFRVELTVRTQDRVPHQHLVFPSSTPRESPVFLSWGTFGPKVEEELSVVLITVKEGCYEGKCHSDFFLHERSVLPFLFT